jgi:hypothetical protein
MFNRSTALVITMLLALPGVVFADPSADTLEIQVALNKDVRSGMSIDEAVTHRIGHSPADAKQIVTTALDMLDRLPSRACIERTSDGKVKRSAPPNYKDCSTRILQAAILAGADPMSVAKASAAGGSTMTTDQPQRKAKDVYLRRLFLFGST